MESSDEESSVRKKRRASENSEVQDEHDTPVKKKLKTEIITTTEDNMDSDSSSDFERPMERAERQMEFGDILKDFDDLNEPACMDRILMYLEEIKDEDYFFMEVTNLWIIKYLPFCSYLYHYEKIG